MGILEKTLGTVENVIGAVGDIAKSTGEAVEGFLSDKAIAYQRGKQLAELEEEFEADTDRYRREKSRLESKIRKGTLFGTDIASQKNLLSLKKNTQ